MVTAISMLRGVNLGPHHRIKMDDLKKMYESLGLGNPQTFIQSGNVIFKTEERDLARLATRIENAIEKTFGFRADCIIRTAAEMKTVIAKNPFAKRRDVAPNKLLVTFLAADPGEAARENVRKLKTEPEEVYMDGRELYIYYANGMARPKLNWSALEKILRTSGTGRNWNSVVKMLEMAEKL